MKCTVACIYVGSVEVVLWHGRGPVCPHCTVGKVEPTEVTVMTLEEAEQDFDVQFLVFHIVVFA